MFHRALDWGEGSGHHGGGDGGGIGGCGVGAAAHDFFGGGDDFVGQADEGEGFDGEVGHVEFPPAHAVGGGALVGVVVIMPAFAHGQDGDPPVIAGVVFGFEVAI